MTARMRVSKASWLLVAIAGIIGLLAASLATFSHLSARGVPTGASIPRAAKEWITGGKVRRPGVETASVASLNPEERRRADDAQHRLRGERGPPHAPMHVDVVVARYDEDLAWLHAVLDDLRGQRVGVTTYIYEKGADVSTGFAGAVVTRLPNVGREAHTYLHHMATVPGREAVSNVTLYLQADLHAFRLSEAQMATALIYQAMRHGLSTNVRNLHITKLGQLQGAPYSFSGVPGADPPWNGTLGEWFDGIFGRHMNLTFPPNQAVSFYQGACFGVRTALRLPEAVIAQGLADLTTGNAPEVAHFFERSWFVVFLAVRDSAAGLALEPRWRQDAMDPFVMERRRRRPSGSFVWDWEGCRSDWTGRDRGKVSYSCVSLRDSARPDSWSWDSS